MLPSEPPDRDEQALRCVARGRLLRELHDELTHRVTAMSLLVMAHRPSDDAEGLLAALDTIGTLTSESMTRLNLLDRVMLSLRSEQAVGLGLDSTELIVCASVPQLVQDQAEVLRAAGFEVAVDLPDADRPTTSITRRTVQDAVLAALAVIRQMGRPGSTCTIAVATPPSLLHLRITADVPGWDGTPTRPDLIELQERVRLTDGSLWVGRDPVTGSPWSLELRLRDG